MHAHNITGKQGFTYTHTHPFVHYYYDKSEKGTIHIIITIIRITISSPVTNRSNNKGFAQLQLPILSETNHAEMSVDSNMLLYSSIFKR